MILQFGDVRDRNRRYIKPTRVTDAGLAHLLPLKLRRLNLYGLRITDEGIAQLTRMKSLRHLNLIRTDVTDEGLTRLSSLRNLETLALREAAPVMMGPGPLSKTKVTFDGVREFQRALPGVTIQYFAADLHLNAFTDDEKVAHVRLADSHDGDVVLQPLDQISAIQSSDVVLEPVGGVTFKNGQNLLLDWSSRRISNFGVKKLMAVAPAVRRLDLRGTYVTDGCVSYLVKLSRMRRLDLRNTAVTSEGVAMIKAALPKCQITIGHSNASGK